jgi:uncharacterized small protein (DUF1192 family)
MQHGMKEETGRITMFGEEAPPRKKITHEVGQDLSPLSLAEIEERIAQLQDEVLRLEAARATKVKTQTAADALFKR